MTTATKSPKAPKQKTPDNAAAKLERAGVPAEAQGRGEAQEEPKAPLKPKKPWDGVEGKQKGSWDVDKRVLVMLKYLDAVGALLPAKTMSQYVSQLLLTELTKLDERYDHDRGAA